MKCEEYQEKISAMVDGELEGSVLELTKTHVAECEHCQRVLQATRIVKGLISNKLHRQVAPVHLRARIRRELEKESSKSTAWSWVTRIFVYNPIPAYATVAVILLVIGFGFGRLTFLPANGSKFIAKQEEIGHNITLQGRLVCINCALHGHQGKPIYCKEHNHVLGIQLADGSIWSILENSDVAGLRNDYADLNKTLIIEGVAYPNAKYIEIRKFKQS